MDELNEVYYPLTKITGSQRDVALLELQNAQNLANNQNKVYSQFANILIASSTLLITFFLNRDKLNVDNLFQANNLMIFSIILSILGVLLLRYFVDLQREITINARKVVILRTMLGLDYNSIHLALPNNRIEGATDPFKVKFFTGWFKFQTIPFWIIMMSVLIIWTLNFYKVDISSTTSNKYFLLDRFNTTWIIGALVIIFIYYRTFRVNLFDKNENLYLHLGVFISKLFRVKLLKNFEHSIYRAKLSYIELARLKVDYTAIIEVLVRIEDQNYFKHKGISYKGILRAFLSQFKYFRKKYGYIRSGGSTLNMQLARTIFIPSDQSELKRKLLELFLGRWLNKVFTKDELLKVYITSVRYGYNIMGLSEAIQKYFFVSNIKNFKLSKSQAFFLVERLSSLTKNVNENRVKHLLKLCDDLQIDQKEVDEIYRNFKMQKK